MANNPDAIDSALNVIEARKFVVKQQGYLATKGATR